MKIDIYKLTERELTDLNRKIVQRLKFLESMRTHTQMLEFSVGDKVSFQSQGRGEVVGILVKYNKKTVTILTEQGQKWNVSPQLLTSVKNSAPKLVKPDNVIELYPDR